MTMLWLPTLYRRENLRRSEVSDEDAIQDVFSEGVEEMRSTLQRHATATTV
jgi:hypothetical protein